MKMPSEVPVMTLPNAILFPGALLPLHIFEPRYRRMLADCLHSHRVFAIAMKKPGCVREIPSTVAGLGLIRAAVTRKDRTSYLILQGLSRIELGKLARRKPYRVHEITPLESESGNDKALAVLTTRLRNLITKRLKQNMLSTQPPGDTMPDSTTPVLEDTLVVYSLQHFLKYLAQIKDPGQIADLVSCTLLSSAAQRQAVLETIDLEKRLRQVIRFLTSEIKNKG
jgi:Lon protease-like protein